MSMIRDLLKERFRRYLLFNISVHVFDDESRRCVVYLTEGKMDGDRGAKKARKNNRWTALVRSSNILAVFVCTGGAIHDLFPDLKPSYSAAFHRIDTGDLSSTPRDCCTEGRRTDRSQLTIRTTNFPVT